MQGGLGRLCKHYEWFKSDPEFSLFLVNNIVEQCHICTVISWKWTSEYLLGTVPQEDCLSETCKTIYWHTTTKSVGKIWTTYILINVWHAFIALTLMLLESVRNMVSLSMPMPQPAVGGKPYSSAVQKFSSTNWASSSPAALSCKPWQNWFSNSTVQNKHGKLYSDFK